MCRTETGPKQKHNLEDKKPTNTIGSSSYDHLHCSRNTEGRADTRRFDAKLQARVGDTRNAERFVEKFGLTPAVCAEIWHDLQSTDIPSARINPRSAKQATMEETR
jgi:hypothetical protein